MARLPSFDNIEIVEPPIQELTKRRHHFFGTLLTGGGCAILLIIGGLIALKFSFGQGPQTLDKVPPNFPVSIPLYDKDNIERIRLIPARYKHRTVQLAALLPGFINTVFNNDQPGGADNKKSAGSSSENFIKRLTRLIERVPPTYRDTIEIEWYNLTADANFIDQYYKKELRKKNYRITVETSGDEVRQFSFRGPGDIEGSLYAEFADRQSGTNHLILTISLPPAPATNK